MKKTKMVLACFIVLLMVFPCLSCGKSKNRVVGVGVTAETSLVNVTINSISATHGDRNSQPEEGKIFLLVDLSVANVSGGTVAVQVIQVDSKIVGFALVDAAGNEYGKTMSQVPEGQEQFERRTLSSGDSMEGVMTFEVPLDWDSLILNINQYEFMKQTVIGSITISSAEISNPEVMETPSADALKVERTYIVQGETGKYQIVSWVENTGKLTGGCNKYSFTLYDAEGKVLGSKSGEYSNSISNIFPSSGRWVMSDVFSGVSGTPAKGELRMGEIWWGDVPSKIPAFSLLQADFTPGQSLTYPSYGAKVVGKFSYSGQELKRADMVIVLLGEGKEPIGTARETVEPIRPGENPFEADFSYNVILPTTPVSSIEASFITP